MATSNTFIIGMPRAATTTLSYHMREHPEIFFPEPMHKEPHFYSADFAPSKYQSFAEYEAIFADADGQKVIAEASVQYLWSEEALRRIPVDSKLILILRYLPEWLVSSHKKQLNSKHETRADINLAIRESIKDTELSITNYWALMNLCPYVRKYQEKFGANLLVLLYEDFQENPDAEYRKILHHLGVSEDVPPIKTKYNSTDTLAAKSLMKKNSLLHSIALWLPPKIRHRAANIYGKLYQKRSKSATPQIFDDDLQIMILEHTQEQANALAQLTGLDFSQWHQRIEASKASSPKP